MNYKQNEKINQVKESTLVVGIDIGSTTQYARAFDWRGIELGKVFTFSNSREGFEAFKAWMRHLQDKYRKSDVIVGIEPTGHYWFGLGAYLEDEGILLVMVNPYAVKQTKELDDKRIKVDHQLQRTSQMKYVIGAPKTESGIRYVPMSEEVVECFHRILANRVAPKTEPMVDGYVGFLFLDKNNKPMVALHWEKYLEHIIEKYNKIYRIQMPKVTPHVCRHTFCSNMAKSGMNPKTLQYIMGHSDISVTLNVYTHVQFDDAQAELLRVVEA